MQIKPLLPRNYNKIIPLWRSLKCPECRRSMPDEIPANGLRRRHTHDCACGASIIVRFNGSAWTWMLFYNFEARPGVDWLMEYDQVKNQTFFSRTIDEDGWDEEVYAYTGFVSHERFRRLLAFA